VAIYFCRQHREKRGSRGAVLSEITLNEIVLRRAWPQIYRRWWTALQSRPRLRPFDLARCTIETSQSIVRPSQFCCVRAPLCRSRSVSDRRRTSSRCKRCWPLVDSQRFVGPKNKPTQDGGTTQRASQLVQPHSRRFRCTVPGMSVGLFDCRADPGQILKTIFRKRSTGRFLDGTRLFVAREMHTLVNVHVCICEDMM
jgi:hypothetical protein